MFDVGTTPTNNMGDSHLTASAILNRFYDAERIYMANPTSEAYAGMAATLAPDIRLEQSPDLPYPGTFIGVDGFLRWSEQMSTHFDKVDVHPEHVLEKGDIVVVVSKVNFRVRRTGEELNNRPLVQIVRVDLEKGAITAMTPFYWDVGGFNRALKVDQS